MMGYRVEYGQAERKAPSFLKKYRLHLLTAAFFLLFVLAVKLYWPEGAAVLSSIFLPGEPTEAQAAFAVLVEDLREGQPFSDAVTTFCREIIADAGVTLQ